MTRLIIVSAVTLLFACGQVKPKIAYNEGIDTTSVIDDRINDTTKILVSELPVKFDSTEVLLFAIGLVDLQERGGYGKYSSGSYDPDMVGYRNRDNLVGNFINVVFQDADGKERKLTNMKLRIRSVNFLRDIFRESGSGYLLYSVSDRDSNGDKTLNHLDLEALYISRIDGSDFRKLTRELHEFYDWGLIKGESRIYFRTLADKNKDGQLTNKDQFHYYHINFSGDQYSVTEYNPLKIFQ